MKVYDYIIYGSSIAGAALALKKSSDGKSVILINRFGFPGGSVTEALSCLQKLEPGNLIGKTKELFERLAARNDSFFSNKNGIYIVNSESVKMELQLMLEESDTELLFHVVPVSIDFNDTSKISLTLAAKEGSIILSSKKIIDASEEYDLSALMPSTFKRDLLARRFNIFITRPDDTRFLSLGILPQSERLNDGRFWLSLDAGQKEDFSAETDIHETLEKFGNILFESNSRIQILPVRSSGIFSAEICGIVDERFTTIDMLTERILGIEESFAKASLAEKFSDRF